MNKVTLWTVLLLSVSTAAEPPLQTPPRLVIEITDAKGRMRGGFAPLDTPATSPETASIRFMTAFGDQQPRAADGAIVVGIGFTGWTEGSSTRVVVLLLLAANNGDTSSRIESIPFLPRRELTRFTLAAGETRHLEEMNALGVEPLIVRAELRQLPTPGGAPPTARPPAPTSVKRSRDIRLPCT